VLLEDKLLNHGDLEQNQILCQILINITSKINFFINFKYFLRVSKPGVNVLLNMGIMRDPYKPPVRPFGGAMRMNSTTRSRNNRPLR